MKQRPVHREARRPLFEELERRLLMSADIPALLDPSLTSGHDPAGQHSLVQDEGGAAERIRHEIVFVDAGLDDYELLVDDLRSASPEAIRIEVILLDTQRDGVEQITDFLNDYEELDAIHVVSHGSEGAAQLGSGWLSADSLDAHSSEIASWADALTDDADLLFYGCDLARGDAGATLLESLSKLTGADVAASADLTGSSALGGDWDLEYHSGTIETNVAVTEAVRSSWLTVLGGTVLESNEPSFAEMPDQAYEVKAGQSFGQTFAHDSATANYEVNKLDVVLYKAADAPSQTITVSLRDSWNGTVLGSNAISSDSLTTSEAWYSFDLGSVTLDDNATYTIQIDSDGLEKVYWGVEDPGDYSNGDLTNSSGSAEPGKDAAFRLITSTNTGFRDPSATGDDYAQWTNPTRAYTSNNSDAAEDRNGQQQDWYGFGFPIPGGATIQGIQIDIEGNNQWEANGVDIEISWDGGASYTSTGKGAIWPISGSDSYQTFGGSADTWGRTWSDTELSDANFRIRLTKTGSEDWYDFQVDHIRAKVFYADANTAPVLANNSLTLSEGGSVVLSGTELSATDAETAAASLTFTVSSVSGGQFELVASPGTAITSFSQAQVTAGAVQFVHDGGEAAPSYDVSVSDGSLSDGPQAAAISFTNQNDAPVLANNSLTVARGGTVILSAADLSAIDPDTAPASLIFTVSNATGGRFELVASPGVAITSFSQAQVTAGAVQFVHYGGASPPSYDVSVSDGSVSDGPEAAAASIAPGALEAPSAAANAETPPSIDTSEPTVQDDRAVEQPVSALQATSEQRTSRELADTRASDPVLPPDLVWAGESRRELEARLPFATPSAHLLSDSGLPQESSAADAPASHDASGSQEQPRPHLFPSLSQIASPQLIAALDQMGSEMSEADRDVEHHDAIIATVEGVALVASAGLVAGLLRSGSLVAMAVTSLPVWRGADPLAVLDISDEERQKRERELRDAEEDEDRDDLAVGLLLDTA